MTFGFAPNWLDFVSTTTPYTGAVPAAVPSRPAALPLPAPRAPATSSMTEVAALVRELFTEGTLSYDQLQSLSSLPELAPLLGEALNSVPAGRRAARKR